MAIMVFKRSVFETRKRPKGLLRPKTRSNLKDVVSVGIAYIILLSAQNVANVAHTGNTYTRLHGNSYRGPARKPSASWWTCLTGRLRRRC